MPGDSITPQRRQQLDTRPTNNGPLHIPLRDALSLHAPHAKVTPHKPTPLCIAKHTLQSFYPKRCM